MFINRRYNTNTLAIEVTILIKLEISRRFIQNIGIVNTPVDKANRNEIKVKMNNNLTSEKIFSGTLISFFI